MIPTMATTIFTQSNANWKFAYSPQNEERMQIMLIDICRGHFNAKTSEDDPVYVQLPPEAGEDENACALLRRHMYGTPRAAEGWQQEYSKRLTRPASHKVWHLHRCSRTESAPLLCRCTATTSLQPARRVS